VIAKGKPFQLLIRHPPYYTSPVIRLGSDRGEKTSTKRVKDPFSFEIGICHVLRNGKQLLFH
jgi:hypothetical protein